MKILFILLLLTTAAVAQVNSVNVNPGTTRVDLTPEQKKGLTDVVLNYNIRAQITWNAVESVKPIGDRLPYVAKTEAVFLADHISAWLTEFENARRAKVGDLPEVKKIAEKLKTLKATKRAEIEALIDAQQEP